MTPARPKAAGSSVAEVRSKRLAVENQFRIEFARPPTTKYCAHRLLIGLQKIGDGLKIGRKRDDRADIQVAIGPSVEPASDAECHGVINGRMTEGAVDADRRQSAVAPALRGDAHNRVSVEQREGDRRIVQVHVTFLDRVDRFR